MTRRDIPNLITLFRIVLVAPLAWALQAEAFGLALLIFVIAGASDGLDGYLARRFGWQSALGALLDPIADKLLLVTVYLVLGGLGFLPFELVMAVILRDLVIVSGAVAYRLWIGSFTMAPSILSKFNTLLQIALALVAVVSFGLDWLPDWFARMLIMVVMTSTVLSGIHYVVIWGGRAWRESRRDVS